MSVFYEGLVVTLFLFHIHAMNAIPRLISGIFPARHSAAHPVETQNLASPDHSIPIHNHNTIAPVSAFPSRGTHGSAL